MKAPGYLKGGDEQHKLEDKPQREEANLYLTCRSIIGTAQALAQVVNVRDDGHAVS